MYGYTFKQVLKGNHKHENKKSKYSYLKRFDVSLCTYKHTYLYIYSCFFYFVIITSVTVTFIIVFIINAVVIFVVVNVMLITA